MPGFSRAFFLVVVPWLPDVTEGVRNRKLCNTRSSSKQCRLRVFSMTFASYYHRKPRVLYLVTGTSPGYLPLLFSYSV